MAMSQPRHPQQPPVNDPRDARAQASAEKAYRKAQRPWYKKKRFILTAAILVVIVIIAVATSVGGRGTTTTSPGGSVAQDPAAPPSFPGATSGDVVAQAGAAVDADGLKVTTTPLKKGDDTLGETLCTKATYSNGTDSPARFSLIDWKLQDPNGTILNTGFTGSDNLLSTGEIAPGGSTTGDVCFNAPQGNPTGKYVVLLDPSFRFSSERIAWLNTL